MSTTSTKEPKVSVASAYSNRNAEAWQSLRKRRLLGLPDDYASKYSKSIFNWYLISPAQRKPKAGCQYP